MRIGGVFVSAVLGFPLHEAVKAGGDGARAVGGKVADDADGVVDEQGRDVLHIVAQLVVGVLGARVLFGGAFEFHQNERQTVDKQDDVGAAVVAVFDVGILIDHREIIVFRLLEVQKTHERRAGLATHGIVDLHAVLQISCKGTVLLHETAALKIADFGECLTDSLQRQAAIDANQRVTQNATHERVGKVRPPHVRRVDVRVAHGFKQLNDRVFVGGFGERHSFYSLSSIAERSVNSFSLLRPLPYV